MSCKNYVKISRFSLFFRYYFIIDTSEYLADNIFVNYQVQVKFGGEFANEDTCYRFISCRISKKDEDKFLNALNELKNKMLLYGHNDYEEFCRSFGEKSLDFIEKQ